MIYHIASLEEWEKAKEVGSYSTNSLDKEGFIHCSDYDQILRVANDIFLGQKNLLILVIDESKLNAKVVREDLHNLNEKFPHVYGKIEMGSVISVRDFIPNEDGFFELPEDLI